MSNLFSIPLKSCESLTGMKKAVMLNGVLHLSPAMYDLVSHAEGEELERLLARIPVVDMGRMPSIYDGLPMTTKVKEWM